MEPLLVFSKAATSVRSNFSDEIDVFATPMSNLVHMGATLGEITLFFKDGNLYAENSIAGGRETKKVNYIQVKLRVRQTQETTVLELFQKRLQKAKETNTVLKFNNETREYAVRGVLEITDIIRPDDPPTNDDIYLSCGTGGSSTDLDPGVVDVANDSFLFYDSDDEGLPKVETISDFIQAIAGDNLTAVNGVLNVTATTDIPGGDRYAVLTKLSDTDNDYDWTETPQFEDQTLAKWSNSNNAALLFHRSRGTDHTNETTLSNDILAEIGFKGTSSINNTSQAGKILVTQTQPATSNSYIESKFELFVGTSTGDQVAFTANEERVISIPNLTDTPTAVRGGLYASSDDELYFGVS